VFGWVPAGPAFYSFYIHASTTDKTAKASLQLHVKISDIRQKLINSETFYKELTKSVRYWPQFTCLKSAFKKGDKDPVISTIRKQLTLLKITPSKPIADEDLFDEALEEGIQAFQKSHSLDSDGIIGQQTCMHLNIMPGTRARAIRQSLTQFDELKAQCGTRYIIVNLPTFNLLAINNDQVELAQSVIVGSRSRPTPISTYPIQSIVLNPSWRVPVSIFVKDKLSKVLADPEYLKRGDYLVYDSNGELLVPNHVHWKDVSLTYFPYKVRQQPGKKNALGAVKFNLQNDELIYMHGTPDTSLFNKGLRALSSGCIRVADPVSLALWVLNSEKVNREILQEKIDLEETVTLNIKTPVSVFTTNIPVWINPNGAIQFGMLNRQ
ncbi:MAG: L,D-transpeptidase family protein, partial [Pseudomonadota bacterium]|nr:L,D-transpeptidase family protein [Pseudomonadota bacterium]